MADNIGFDPVAWAINGGRIDGAIMRVLAYAATSGAEGIVSPGDCKVHQLTTPGAQVAIDPGALIVRNSSPNVKNQTYVANGRAQTLLDVNATTSAGARSDAVIVRFRDPDFAPWQAPAPGDAPTYQYVDPEIIYGVPSTATSAADLNLGYSAYMLARIDRPANTNTVLDSHVVNTREVANPRTKRFHKRLQLPYSAQINSTQGLTPLWITTKVDVPSWAVRAVIRADLTGIIIKNFPIAGVVLSTIGPMGGPKIETGVTYWNEQQIDRRVSYLASDDCYVPPAIRGAKQQDFYMVGSVIDGNGVFFADTNTQQILEVEFIEAAS